MQRIFKCGDIQNTVVALDKKLNTGILHALYVILYNKSYKLLNMVRFLAHLCDRVTVTGVTTHGSRHVLYVFIQDKPLDERLS